MSEQDLERSRQLAARMQQEIEAGHLPSVVFETLTFFMERIQELEARVDILERALEGGEQ